MVWLVPVTAKSARVWRLGLFDTIESSEARPLTQSRRVLRTAYVGSWWGLAGGASRRQRGERKRDKEAQGRSPLPPAAYFRQPFRGSAGGLVGDVGPWPEASGKPGRPGGAARVAKPKLAYKDVDPRTCLCA